MACHAQPSLTFAGSFAGSDGLRYDISAALPTSANTTAAAAASPRMPRRAIRRSRIRLIGPLRRSLVGTASMKSRRAWGAAGR